MRNEEIDHSESIAKFISNFPAEPAELSYETNSTLQHYALAGFGQGTLRLTPRARITAGARYTHDSTANQPSNFYNLFGVTAPEEVSEGVWTGKVEGDYDLAAANMVYASWSRGYKPTGLNFNPQEIATPTAFRKETVEAYEVGSKNRFLRDRLQLDAAAFYYVYRNFQFTEEDPVPNSGGTANIPRADDYGVEAEGSYLIVPGLRFDANLTWLQGYFRGHYDAIDAVAAAQARAAQAALGYGEYSPQAIAAVEAAAADTDGNPIPKSPEWQGTARLTYTRDFAPGEFTARGEFVYRSSYIYRIFDVGPLDKVPMYDIWNLYLAWRPTGSRFTYSFSGVNLFDRDGVNSRFTNPYGELTTSQEFIAPRQVFADVRYAF